MNPYVIKVVDSYIAAGDDTPQADSRFHTFPSLTRCSDGSFVGTTLAGRQKTAPDGRTQVFRSTDDCRTWVSMTSPTICDEKTNAGWGYMMCHFAETSPGHLLAAYARTDRFNPDEPLFHPETSGMQPTRVRLTESDNHGQTWSQPWDLDYQLPDLIAPGQFLRLGDGTLGMPFEVWHEWEQGFRDGPSTRLIISRDNGKTWPEVGIIARDDSCQLIYGDPRLTRLPDGRLVALLWAHNFQTEKDLPAHRTESVDNGRTWSPVHDTGLTSQIANPAWLCDGLMLAVYQRRFGAKAGLRAILSEDNGLTWDHNTDTGIWAWGHHTNDLNPFSGYEQYAFGYSTISPLTEYEVLVPFWASNGKTTYIRILRVAIESH